jgi:hypothetical protein
MLKTGLPTRVNLTPIELLAAAALGGWLSIHPSISAPPVASCISRAGGRAQNKQIKHTLRHRPVEYCMRLIATQQSLTHQQL